MVGAVEFAGSVSSQSSLLSGHRIFLREGHFHVALSVLKFIP